LGGFRSIPSDGDAIFLGIVRYSSTSISGHTYPRGWLFESLNTLNRQLDPIAFGEFLLTGCRIDCCDRLLVNLFAQLFDDGV